MRVADVVRHKGDAVVTIDPGQTVAQLLDLLDQHRIGAVVVSSDGTSVEGIVSERDVVRHLHLRGGDMLGDTVASIMTAEVTTCEPDTGIEALARTMTELRVRHVPVVVDGRLRAIVSIGDIVKHRIDELQAEREALIGYIHQ